MPTDSCNDPNRTTQINPQDLFHAVIILPDQIDIKHIYRDFRIIELALSTAEVSRLAR